MSQSDNISSVLRIWAPDLAENFHTLGYLGSERSIGWFTETEWPSQLNALIHQDGYATAAVMCHMAVKEKVSFVAPIQLLMLEHMRRSPANTGELLRNLGLNRFSLTLANLSFLAASALYESAKDSFAGDEIDSAIARFQAALSEFRFSIESEQLADYNKKKATGKYATAVAMIGRWVNVSNEVASRALSYSLESMALGNLKPETLMYRLELLILQFDQTGNPDLLHVALALLSENREITEGSELAEAEARLRLSLFFMPKTKDAKRYINGARKRLALSRSRNGFEESRHGILLALIAVVEQGDTALSALSARSVGIPRGLLASMATQPSTNLWFIIRRVIDALEGLRISRGLVPAAVLSARFLRQMIDGPVELLNEHDRTRYIEVTSWLANKLPWNRHVQWGAGAAALSVAKQTENLQLAQKAQLIFDKLAIIYSVWPLPKIGVARACEYLGCNIEDVNTAWQEAAVLALNSMDYGRSNLGGRNEVFAVADARGFLSETFVFKRTTKEKAEHEASMLDLLRNEIICQNKAYQFGVPRSLTIVDVTANDARQWVHVTQRAAGRLVSELPREEASEIIEPIVDFLAIFHNIAGKATPGKSAWGPLKGQIKLWSKTLFTSMQLDHFVKALSSIFPRDLPLVRKRDGHASNWLVDSAGRIIAIDLESTDFIPIGYDVVQLIEDNGLIQANFEGWRKRLTIMNRYLIGTGNNLSEPDLIDAYGWFALVRALRLGTEKEAGKQLRRHARELCGLLVEHGGDSIKNLARELLNVLSRTEQLNTDELPPSYDHRRLSKSMAYQLRHQGPSNGIQIDSDGFALIEELALVLNVDSSQLLAVAEHPGEPRFEIRNKFIRALYGHSLSHVAIDNASKVDRPIALFHGSSWSAVNTIIESGLLPMQRRMVHLTNVAEEALAVGRRKGAPLVFVIDQTGDEKPVAEGIWVTERVSPNSLYIINPFIEEVGFIR